MERKDGRKTRKEGRKKKGKHVKKERGREGGKEVAVAREKKMNKSLRLTFVFHAPFKKKLKEERKNKSDFCDCTFGGWMITQTFCPVPTNHRTTVTTDCYDQSL
jgi:hypothetical protein